LTKVRKEFLIDYDISTLRDVDYQGQSPSNNSYLKWNNSSSKWVPSKLNGISATSIGEVIEESDTLIEGRFAILKDPILGLYDINVEGDLVII